jgi:AcrR family transcriptional regulator
VGRPNRDGQILAAALSVFAERGYDGARVRHIAQRAGVSDGALYSHHPSKQAVALALLFHHLERHCELIEEVAIDRSLTVEERVRRIAWRMLQAFAEEPDAVTFVITHQARFAESLPADFPVPIRIVEGLVVEGQRDGSVRPGPAGVLAALALGCVLQPMRSVLESGPGTFDLGQQAARALVADAAWRAIATP